ncbi:MULTISPECIES: hypothetical protein [unclassified Corynebacterium]|uniref:hypothetical protein n=1 Tax=unclassified Corynebacterium TaxID=2624378 RepID=UPI0008A62695|nr:MULTISPECIES: hypothetical protein [unclassified Corynebacterium]OFK91282.1 hypothetical protein HMPREF2792_04270 [Corynebacterium sp. HMSC068H04]OFL61221.1 hypothetical protein HMPREF2760_08475 [Corynebacterium sp. HMSC065D07]OFM30505.1 hypothetical protein HMPREF2698_12160 [Corynebacterium sp. HMSC072A02]OFP87665.1 hypothetical protein HMPREF2967_08910 [Corynebacterium sp. HMSC059E07]
MFLTVALAVITASELWAAWKALRKPLSTANRLVTATIAILAILFIGYVMPWHTSVSFGWWYALVAACSLHIGAVAWQAVQPSSHADAGQEAPVR